MYKGVIRIAHRVKCSICGQTFDRDAQPFVKTSGRRYAHYKCATGEDPPKNQEEIDKENLYAYIMKLFDLEYVLPKLQKQIKKYQDEYNYTYSGIHGALCYAFEVKKMKVQKDNATLGIVPYIYEDAKKYYNSISQIQKENKTQIIKEKEMEKPQDVIIYIKSPQRKMRRRNLFSFLDEEGNSK